MKNTIFKFKYTVSKCPDYKYVSNNKEIHLHEIIEMPNYFIPNHDCVFLKGCLINKELKTGPDSDYTNCDIIFDDNEFIFVIDFNIREGRFPSSFKSKYYKFLYYLCMKDKRNFKINNLLNENIR